MLLPDWAYFNMYELSSWSRATIIPLSVVMTTRPVYKLPPHARVQELFVRPPRHIDYTFTKEDGILTWKNFFIGVDHLLKVYEASPIRIFKQKATKKAERWILEHQEKPEIGAAFSLQCSTPSWPCTVWAMPMTTRLWSRDLRRWPTSALKMMTP